MKYRILGNTGVKVSVIGLGANNFGGRNDEPSSFRVLDQALDLGVNFIDTADFYNLGNSEQVIGKWLKSHRDHVVIATKFVMAMDDYPNSRGASRYHIFNAVEDSLRRLNTDHIDLYQVHWPDPETPIEQTLRALDDLVKQGKIRYFGSSNFSAVQLSEALWTSRYFNLNSLVSEQCYYNLLKRGVESEVVPYAASNGLSIIPFFPLESGLLTGKYRRNEPIPEGTRMASGEFYQRSLTDENFEKVDKLSSFAQERGHTVGELALAWLLANPAVCSVIAGASNPEQVVQNVEAAGWDLSRRFERNRRDRAPVVEPQALRPLLRKRLLLGLPTDLLQQRLQPPPRHAHLAPVTTLLFAALLLGAHASLTRMDSKPLPVAHPETAASRASQTTPSNAELCPGTYPQARSRSSGGPV